MRSAQKVRKVFTFRSAGLALYVDYTVVNDELADHIVQSPFLNYLPALKIGPWEGLKVLACIWEPYFSRTKAHYTLHQNIPYRTENAGHPAVLQKGNVILAAHPLNRIYKEYGTRVHRELFRNMMAKLLDRPMITASLPSAGRLILLHFPEKSRYVVVHLLYGLSIIVPKFSCHTAIVFEY
jgi:hypothetical protein